MLRRLVVSFRFGSRKDLQQKFELKKDPYNALHYTLSQPIETKQFENYMNDVLAQNKKGATSSIWVHLNSKNLHHISSLVNVCGFKMHRGKGSEVSLYRWMRQGKKDLVPAYSMFVISCGGIIIHNDKILLVCEKSGQLKGRYGLPGGRADLGECIRTCSEREVWEEVGLKVNFNKVLWFRELSSYVYGSFDTYFACIMDIEEGELANLKLCQDQVDHVEWIHLSQLGQFMANRSTGTQLKLANYIQKLYNEGYNFKSPSNYRWENYISNIDQRQRFFGQHLLAN